MKIMTIAGARPNFMKMASIVEAIRSHNGAGGLPEIKHILVHTGQHYDESLSKCFFDELGLPRPDVNLEVGSGSHAQQTAEIMRRFEPVLLVEQPDVLIVVGDVNSTVACALVAAKIQYSSQNPTGIERPFIVHVEAGLRSGDRSMPEEINRLLTDALTDALFVTEEAAVINLLREGIPKEKIFFVGNVMIDTLHMHLEKARRSAIQKILKINGRYGLVTLHRPSNVDTKDALEPLIRCFQEISRDLFLVLPLHPRTKVSLEKLGLMEEFNNTQGISLIDPLGYLDFLNLLDSATMVLTDSGGIQEETTALGVPCITLRENTERPVTVTMGTNYLVGTDPAGILATAREILSGKGKRGKIPQYWDGLSGERIVAGLKDIIYNGKT
ncbi:MAG: UDP-N-acetylglucosamine 2-epimerase (non-hydrolyzing) [Thermodesulfobacteriota bacterium]|nr:UDP-N-acetylglucosamine 2-epimerase (non-hydrolyzing) [Thermodesulfobacteriota bacterium]